MEQNHIAIISKLRWYYKAILIQLIHFRSPQQISENYKLP